MNGKSNEILFEYLKVYGGDEAIPKTKKEISIMHFKISIKTIHNDKKKSSNWSFTDFIAGLEAPVQKNALLLGSYSSDTDLKK